MLRSDLRAFALFPQAVLGYGECAVLFVNLSELRQEQVVRTCGFKCLLLYKHIALTRVYHSLICKASLALGVDVEADQDLSAPGSDIDLDGLKEVTLRCLHVLAGTCPKRNRCHHWLQVVRHSRLRFSRDLRVKEVARLLRSSRAMRLRMSAEASEADFERSKQVSARCFV